MAMSDLIERLEAARRSAILKPDFGFNFKLKDIEEAISALETLRRIEAAKRILIEWDEEVKVWRVNTFTSAGWQSGKTVSLAVDAAVGAKKQ